MRYVAITPDAMRPATLRRRLAEIREKGASMLYLRSPSLQGDLDEILPAVNEAGMLPLVPFRSEPLRSAARRGVHFKQAETRRIGPRLLASHAVTSAACHASDSARLLLAMGVSYVFVSPVFHPLSKPMAHEAGGLFPRDELRELADRYGDRVVALGGMRPDRVRALRREIGRDFSVAGITLFFGRDGA